jgi:hypothetical protein
VITLTANSWKSNLFEVTKSGSVVRHIVSPEQYGTGVCVRGDTLLLADRLMSANRGDFAIDRALTSNLDFGIGPLDLYSRRSLYGPRGLAFDTALGVYLMAYTDFQGDISFPRLFGSYLLLLDPMDGSEVKSYPIVEGGSAPTNIRGLEYDPRGAGNSAWITTLNNGGGSKLVKVVLTDGPASLTQPHSAVHDAAQNQGNALDQNYPNPCATQTTFPYSLAHSGRVEIRLLEALGRALQTTSFDAAPGEHERSLDLSSLPDGTYLVELRLDGQRIGARNLTLLR